MTEATRIQPIQHQSPSPRFSGNSEAAGLTLEIGKCLKLVAPGTMNAEAQTMWLAAAVDALEGIRADEVAHISAEVRRSVTRAAQIVPEISRLVAERRERSSRYSDVPVPRSLPELPKPPSPPLTALEIERMPKWLKDMGLRVGFLVRRNGHLVDMAANP